MEKDANKYFNNIEKIGGVISGIESGYFQKEIADSATIYNNKIENKERVMVGVNDFIKENEKIDIPILEISDEVQKFQIKNLSKLKSSRNNEDVFNKLDKITSACETKENLMPLIIDAALSYATLGEIVDSIKKVFGEWQENSII